MPYKNPEDRAKSRALYYPVISVRIAKQETELYNAINNAAKSAGMSIPEFLRQSAREKLIRDGYLLPDDK